MNDTQIRLVAFYAAYVKLLHAEAHVIAMVLDAGYSINDLVVAHNIIEEAKNAVVREFLGLKIGLNPGL